MNFFEGKSELNSTISGGISEHLLRKVLAAVVAEAVAGRGRLAENHWKMMKYMKIHRFSLKMSGFEQNDRIFSILGGPGGVYDGTCGV